VITVSRCAVDCLSRNDVLNAHLLSAPSASKVEEGQVSSEEEPQEEDRQESKEEETKEDERRDKDHKDDEKDPFGELTTLSQVSEAGQKTTPSRKVRTETLERVKGSKEAHPRRKRDWMPKARMKED